MSMDDMKDTRTKLVEAADKLSAYVEGMERLTEYAGELWKEMEAANSALSSAAKEKQLKNTADALEKMNDELKALKSALANFSDRGSLVRQRIEKATMMTAEIRDIDARVARLCKSFNRLNRSRIADLVVAVGRFEVTSNDLKGGLDYLREKVCDKGEHLNSINKKLSAIELLQSENEALDREIKARILDMDNKDFLMFKRKITGDTSIKANIEKELPNPAIGDKKGKMAVQDWPDKIEVGDEIIFGRKSKCDLIWRVLEKTKTGLFLLSKFGITERAFNNNGNVTWQDSSLRKYLNNGFIKNYFDEIEGSMIRKASVAGKHWKWDKAKAEEIGKDKVFLLSGKDLGNYFTGTEDRICYGITGGEISTIPCKWWLRDTTRKNVKPSTINKEGEVNNSGQTDSDENYFVRPVMWIEPPHTDMVLKVGETQEGSLLVRQASIDVETLQKVSDSDCSNENIESTGKTGKIIAVTKKEIGRSNWYYNVKVQQPDAKLKKGNVVAFGRWQGKKILWRVLCRKKGQLCLISLFGLEPLAFHTGKDIVTWKDSSIRQYLNTAFLEKCFCNQEIEKIVDKNVRYLDIIAEGNSKFSWSIDNIYLPSRKEVEDLEEDPVNLRCMAIDGTNEECDWWLRTPGRNAAYAVCVGRDGNIISKGYKADSKKRKVYIRPIMWINVEKM